jgi:outer membrane protein OmpA-like peptidoglycan-associated protein
MGALLAGWALALIAILQSGPPITERIILLPGQDGKPSAVVIKSAKGETVLDRPYSGASIDASGAIRSREEDPAAVKEFYSTTLAALPQHPKAFILYFETGSDELVPESVPLLAQIQRELGQRAEPEIIVIGHTDTVDTLEYNDALSIKRAEAMKLVLVAAGIPAERISTAGRGERELLIPTKDGVDEPKNRRVEIRVR